MDLMLISLNRRHAPGSAKDFGIGSRLHQPRLSHKFHGGHLAPAQSAGLLRTWNRNPIERIVTPAILHRGERRADGDENSVMNRRSPRCVRSDI
jgi:hypothetical protein